MFGVEHSNSSPGAVWSCENASAGVSSGMQVSSVKVLCWVEFEFVSGGGLASFFTGDFGVLSGV